MTPLADSLDTRSNSDVPYNNEERSKCSSCKQELVVSAFPMKTRGPGKGEARASTCRDCLDRRASKRGSEKEERDAALPVMSFGRLLSVLEGYRAGSNQPCEVEARVSSAAFSHENEKVKADSMVGAISEALGWRFTYVGRCRVGRPQSLTFPLTGTGT